MRLLLHTQATNGPSPIISSIATFGSSLFLFWATRANTCGRSSSSVADPANGEAMTAWLQRYQGGCFEHNADGHHVLHELIEQFRSSKVNFDKELLQEGVRMMKLHCGGLEVQTIGEYPLATTAVFSTSFIADSDVLAVAGPEEVLFGKRLH